jgi:hypothetical protein
MKVWRKLSQIGAVPFKGSGYILPNNEENYEYFQWLISEVMDRGGEGAFVQIDRIESLTETEIIELFNRSREKEFLPIEEALEAIEKGAISLDQGDNPEIRKKLIENFTRLTKEFEHIRKVDFFASPKGIFLEKKINTVRAAIRNFSAHKKSKAENPIIPRNRKDYLGKVWVTRKRPYVDRIASAWLIRSFIDSKAIFKFIGEGQSARSNKSTVFYDIKDGEFTHHGDLCTFEVLIRSFDLKDQALKKLAEVVHQIDLRDKKYPAPESVGVEELLKGIRKMITDDQEILDKGISVFEMLYASKKQE